MAESRPVNVGQRYALLFAALSIFGFCFALRGLDVFVIRSDAWFGEQVVTKVVGLAVVVTYVLRSGLGLTALGFRKPSLRLLLLAGLAFTVTAMLLALSLLHGFLGLQGAWPQISIGIKGFVIGGEAETRTAFAPAAMLIASNLVNALMEESLFRGLLLVRLAAVTTATRANMIQAVLFGLWHLVWPLRAGVDGDMTPVAALTYGAGYVVVSTIIGFVWGCLILWFRNLWVTVLSHAVHNALLNIINITTISGGSTIALFTTVEVFVFLALLPVIARYRRRRSNQQR